MIASGRDSAAETGDVKGPPLRNRTVLALAEVVSACFDFTINLGGNFEPRVRPDWFADFLYGDEFPASLIQRARQLHPQVGAIKYFVLGLDSGAGTTPQISPVAGTADQRISVTDGPLEPPPTLEHDRSTENDHGRARST